MLHQRLDKLETDLHLLIGMHDLFLQSDTESVIDGGEDRSPDLAVDRSNRRLFGDDVPERDVPHDVQKTSFKTKRSSKEIPSSSAAKKEAMVTTVVSSADDHEKSVKSVQELLDAERIRNEDLWKERSALQENLDKERRHRKEVEDSAKHLFIQLEKYRDDLHREKEMKENLLLESLHLKSKLDESQQEITKLKDYSSDWQAKLGKLEGTVKQVSREKANLIQKLQYLCQELGLNPRDPHHPGRRGTGAGATPFFLKVDDDNPDSYLEFLKGHIQLLKRISNREEGSGEQIRKLGVQLNTLVGRCVTLEKERDSLKLELGDCQDRIEHLKNHLHTSQLTATSSESDFLKKQIENECHLQKVTSELNHCRDNFSKKMNDYSKLIKRSKELLLNLRQERDIGQQRLQEVVNSKKQLELHIKRLTNDLRQRSLENGDLKQKLLNLKEQKMEETEGFKMEELNLKVTLKKYSGERRKLLDLLGEMKHQLISMKTRWEHDRSLFSVEKANILDEKRRLEENLAILRKISEDQGQTIGKLRGDLEDSKVINSKLDNELREYQSREGQLIRRLEQAEKEGDRYIRHIDELEEKIGRYLEELKNHDCEEHVNSKYKRKAEELEEYLEEKGREWDRNFEEIRREKEVALESSKDILEKMEEMKGAHQRILVEVKGKFQKEFERVQGLWRKREEERVKKIRDLQSELERLQTSSSQMQGALSSKIKQLQTALGICFGGGSGGPSTTPTPNHQFSSNLHQPHQQNPLFSGFPSEGYTYFNGFGGNPPTNLIDYSCTSSGGGSGLNLNGGINATQTQDDLLNVDFFSNLML